MCLSVDDTTQCTKLIEFLKLLEDVTFVRFDLFTNENNEFGSFKKIIV